MKYKLLKDVCNINMGQSPDSNSYNENGDGVPFFQGNADFGERYPIVKKWCNAPTKMATSEDILISVRAPIGAVNYAKEDCCIGRGLAAITPDKTKVSPEFIFWLLKRKKDELNDKGTGSTFKAIGRTVLEEILIPDIEIEKQIESAAILEKMYLVMQSKHQEISKLDDLVKARFVEMFGAVYNNKFGYEIKTLQDICEQIKDGTHQTPTYTDDSVNGYKFLSSKDVTTGKIDWTHLKHIPEKLHKELYARIAPRKGDILLAKNGTTGIAAIVDRDEVFDIYVSLALLRPINVDPVYLWVAINSAETKQQFDACLKGIGVPNLHLGEIKKAQVIVPPINEQKQFAAFVEQVDKSKAAVQKSLDKLQTLFDKLMQEYFG